MYSHWLKNNIHLINFNVFCSIVIKRAHSNYFNYFYSEGSIFTFFKFSAYQGKQCDQKKIAKCL